MRNLPPVEPIDYLLIGNVTQDVVPQGYLLGGTASYSALTARAMGLRVGVVTACHPDLELPELEGISVVRHPSEHSTTFANIHTEHGRVQYLHHRARELDLSMVPEAWRSPRIVHLGPIAQEVDVKLARAFPESFVGVTPQGWLRSWDESGKVTYTDWLEARYVLEAASAAVISVEDVRGDESVIEDMLSAVRVLVVTEGVYGARLYWNGDMRYFRAPSQTEVDPTGAGDIFAAVFFSRLEFTRDPWEAARLATQLAALSVTRKGLAGVPTEEEVKAHLIEIFES
jgi:sugar/nucleoside kinase (ribokinase family)